MDIPKDISVGEPMKLLEAQILRAILKLLMVYEARGKLIFRRINSGPVLRGNFGQGKGQFSRNPAAGISDLMVWIHGGPVISAEVKSRRGILSPEQQRFGRELEKMGHAYVIWRSVDDALKTLEKHCGVISVSF